MENNKNRVLILVPHHSDKIYTKAAISIMQQLSNCSNIIFPHSGSESLAVIRNTLVEHALKSSATHFLWLDGDELFPKDMVPRLLAHDKDIVAAWTMIRQSQTPNVYNIVNKTERGGYKHKPVYGKGLMKRDRVGFGSVLIRREVFEKLEPPWFDFSEHAICEDIFFCDKAREFGYEIWVDYDLRCGHLSVVTL